MAQEILRAKENRHRKALPMGERVDFPFLLLLLVLLTTLLLTLSLLCLRPVTTW